MTEGTNADQKPENNSASENKLKYYTKLGYRWRKFLITHLILVAIGAVIIALIIPKTFTSSATILPESSQNIANMILPQKMTEGLGGAIGALTGSAANETNTIMSILKSRDLAVRTIDEFGLMEKFEAESIEDAILEFREMVFVTIDDELMIRVSVHAKSKFFNFAEDVENTRLFAHEMAQFIVSELDRRFTNLNVEKATFERVLVEERFNQNREDLRRAENEFKEFSERNSMISLPDQVQAAVETAAVLETQIITSQIELAAMAQTMSSNRPEYRQKQITIEEAERRLNDLKIFGSSEDSLKVLPSFKAAPELAMEFVQLQREVQIQNLLYEFLVQQYEHLKLQEARQAPSLQFIDRPAIPTKRTSPVRSLLTIVLFLIGSIAGIAYVMGYELYTSKYKEMLRETLREAKSA